MKSVRFAPTLSGDMHIGALLNAFLNYAYAVQNSIAFNVRFDGQKVGPSRMVWGEHILEDLEVFGMKHHKVIYQKDHVEEYREKAKRLADHPDTYFCDCREWELAQRWYEQPGMMRGLVRLEKYPAYCNLQEFRVFGGEVGENVTDHFIWEAPEFDPDHLLSNALGRYDEKYWAPFPQGYLGDRTIKIKGKVKEGHPHELVKGVEFLWQDIPPTEVSVYCDNIRMGWAGHINFYASSFAPGCKDAASRIQRISFCVKPANTITISIDQMSYRIMREYFYDDYCRNRLMKCDFNDPRTVLRVKDAPRIDTAIWFNQMPDLCLTSAMDDWRENVVLAIRGSDIETFTTLEKGAASLVGNYKPKNMFHPVLTNEVGVKYSKFVHSPRVTDLMKEVPLSPEQVFGFLVHLIVPSRKPEPVSLEKAVELVNFDSAIFKEEFIVVPETWAEDL